MAVSTSRKGGVDVQGAFGEFWKKNSQNILPPILGLLGFLFIWQFLSSTGLIKLPPPTSVWTDERTRILLMYPFMNSKTYGVGLFWQTLASLERVAKGYTLAAIVGISMGVVVGTNPFLNKALDPIFQFLRMGSAFGLGTDRPSCITTKRTCCFVRNFYHFSVADFD
jgi:bicarbonate transport system permease protein